MFTFSAQAIFLKMIYQINLLEDQQQKKRRPFDAVTFKLEAYIKKTKIQETLEPLDSPPRLCILDKFQSLRHINLAWVLSHFFKLPYTPSWVGFNNMIQHETSCKEKIAYLTTINSSPTNISGVLETMRQRQQMAQECNEPYMEITYDLANVKITLQIQSSEKQRFDNLFIHFGAFHIMMAYFKAVGILIYIISSLNNSSRKFFKLEKYRNHG